MDNEARTPGGTSLPKDTPLLLYIKIISENHFNIQFESPMTPNDSDKCTQEKGLDLINQDLTVELTNFQLSDLPEVLQYKERDGEIRLTSCCHTIVHINKAHVLEALRLHKSSLASSPNSQSKNGLKHSIENLIVDESSVYTYLSLFIMFSMEEHLQALLAHLRTDLNMKVCIFGLALSLTVNHLPCVLFFIE